MSKNYALVSGLIFAIVALVQIARAITQTPVQIGTFAVPMFASWVVAAGATGLCLWAFRSRS